MFEASNHRPRTPHGTPQKARCSGLSCPLEHLLQLLAAQASVSGLAELVQHQWAPFAPRLGATALLLRLGVGELLEFHVVFRLPFGRFRDWLPALRQFTA